MAAALPVDRSTVIRWEAGDHAPLPYLRPKLARLLGCSQDRLREVIDGTIGDRPGSDDPAVPIEPGVNLHWLDQWAGWAPGTGRRKLAAQLNKTGRRESADGHRPKVGRSRIAEALSAYYPDRSDGLGLYGASCDRTRVETSILTRDDWLDLDCRLPGQERMVLAPGDRTPHTPSGSYETTQAVRRLAEATASGVRMSDEPIYRLVGVDVDEGVISGEFSVASFTEYALTMDLLEAELTAAITGGAADLPLRESYLS